MRTEITQEQAMQSTPFDLDALQPCQPDPLLAPAEDYGCLAVDSKNAYGLMFRSTMLRAARLRTLRLAGRQATQWSRPTIFWVRLEGLWTRMSTNRGGWQGSQLMMNMFALGLEEVFQPREHVLLQQGVARLTYADDLHLFGKISGLKMRWNLVIGTLKDAGLEVLPTKPKFWSPSADMRQSLSLPVRPAVEDFDSLVKRSIGGLDLLGGAAATEHDVATFVSTAPTRITVHVEKRIKKSGLHADRLRQFQVPQTTSHDSHKLGDRNQVPSQGFLLRRCFDTLRGVGASMSQR